MDMVSFKNIGAMETVRVAAAVTSVTAGGAGNATAVTGITFQRSTMGLPLSAVLLLAYTTTLAAGKTLSLGTVKIQDSADGTTFADWQVITDPGVVASATGVGVVPLAAHLGGARDYIRILFTPTLSNTSSDTAIITALLAFAGFTRLPAPV